MAKASDKEIKNAIKKAQNVIQEVKEQDGNEAETRRRVERIFEDILGYQIQHLSREHAVRGSGTTEHLDFAIKLDPEKEEVSMVVELKRIGIDLSPKHLKQASRYAIDLGCEWALLTNGRQWELHHIEFGQPPDIRRIKFWNLLEDGIDSLVENFQSISYRRLKRGALHILWQKYSTLKPERLLYYLLSEDSLKRLTRSIRKESGISVHPEEIVFAFRRLLNENTSRLVDSVQISYPKPNKAPKPKKSNNQDAVFDRVYWENKSSAQVISMMDKVLGMVKRFDSVLELNFNKFYVGFEKDGKPRNFMRLVPQRKRMKLILALEKSSAICSKLQAKGLVEQFNQSGQPVLFISPEEFGKHAVSLSEVAQHAYQAFRK